MRILAFDQATLITGYSIIDKDVVEEYGVLKKSKKNFPTTDIRCRAMAIAMCELIGEKKPEVVAIEDVALQRNPKVLIQLSRIQGEILGYCDFKDIPVVILKPSEWRKLVGIKQGNKSRKLLKSEAEILVKEKFGIDATEDEADAICIGYALWLNEKAKSEENEEETDNE